MSGDPYFDKVSLLLHMDGSNNSTTFTDNSPNRFTVTASGTAKISTAESKFGGASAYFDGNQDYLSIPHTVLLNLPDDFTIEAWIYNTSTASNIKMIANKWVGGYSLYLTATNKLAFAQDDVVELVVSTGTVPTNQWVYVAAVRSGASLKLYIDGVNDGQTTSSVNFTSTNQSFVGLGFVTSTFGIVGYIDDLRITKGIARYTANFTPPDAPFPDYMDLRGLPNRVSQRTSSTINRIHYQRL